MKLSELLPLFEYPATIPDMDVDHFSTDPKSNMDEYNRIFKKYPLEKISTFDDIDLYYAEKGSNECYAIVKDNVLLFNAELHLENNKKIGTYAYVSWIWVHDELYKYASNVPILIYFNYILPKHKILTTDRYHTLKGKNYWISKVIPHAFNIGYNVYFFNTATNILIPLQNIQDVLKYSPQIWSKNINYTERLVVITKKKLKT